MSEQQMRYWEFMRNGGVDPFVTRVRELFDLRYLGLTGDQAYALHKKYLHMGVDDFMDRWHRLRLSA